MTHDDYVKWRDEEIKHIQYELDRIFEGIRTMDDLKAARDKQKRLRQRLDELVTIDESYHATGGGSSTLH